MRTGAANRLDFADHHPEPADFFAEVIDGLGRAPKVIPPKFFYDAEGSRLFEAICRLPEYYPTRTESGILAARVTDIVAAVGTNCCIIEPGSGSSDKVRLLLDALRPHSYLPLDISKSHLLDAANKLTQDFPWLKVHAVCVDFTDVLSLPTPAGPVRKVAFFPGSSIGNFEPADAAVFLDDLRTAVGAGGGLLIGVDLKKDAATLNAAYNDAAGVTARFNKNLLVRINRELGAGFRLEHFAHRAFYNQALGRIEMHLESLCQQSLQIGGRGFAFARGETIHTENSYKYSVPEFQALAAEAGFRAVNAWTDANDLFSVHFLEVA